MTSLLDAARGALAGIVAAAGGSNATGPDTDASDAAPVRASWPLDHVVIAVHDLGAAIADYTALGFTVFPGGAHPGRTTHNALVVFADGSYFELIAWRSPSPGERWWELLQRHGEGIVDFALLPHDTGAVVAAARGRGLSLDGPLDGGRLRPDGERLRWQTARPPSPDLPFLCGDVTPRALRVPEGDVRVHANGALGIGTLAIAVEDLDATRSRYRALFGEAADAGLGHGGDGIDIGIGIGRDGSGASRVGPPVALPGTGTRLAVVALAQGALVLSAPRDPAGGLPDPLAQRLATRGAGPYALLLRTSDGAASSAPLDAERTHGVSIEWTA